MKIYKFYADWCMPCKQLAKKLESSDINDLIIPIDCDEDSDDLCGKYGIRNIPTIVFADDNGNMLDKISGNVSVQAIKDKIAQFK